MKGHVLRAMVVGVIFVIIYFAIQIMLGIYRTINYVPDIVESYQATNYVQHNVTFGAQISSIWNVIEIPALMLLGIVVYYTLRGWKDKKMSRHK